MRRMMIASALSFMFFIGAVAAQNPQTTPVHSHPNFAGIVATLKELAAREGRTRRNTFFIADVWREDGRDYSYAYWKEDKSIIILQLPLEKESASYDWLYGKARVDLETDVVPTQEDIGGSSFLVDREWVNKILKECAGGFKLSVVKARKSKRLYLNFLGSAGLTKRASGTGRLYSTDS